MHEYNTTIRHGHRNRERVIPTPDQVIEKNLSCYFYCPMCDEKWQSRYEEGIKHMCLNSRD